MTTTRPTVLIVDDAPDIRKMHNTILSLEGYRTLQAADGAEALDVMRTSPEPLIVVTGLIMPGMGGQEMLRRADREGLLERHVVVIVSGAAPFVRRDNDVAELIDRYKIQVLAKPITADALFEAVELVAKRLRPIH